MDLRSWDHRLGAGWAACGNFGWDPCPADLHSSHWPGRAVEWPMAATCVSIDAATTRPGNYQYQTTAVSL